MKIYTKKGDGGRTGLVGGQRVDKDNPRIEAYGTVDELNALIGVLRCRDLPEEWNRWLGLVQADLFVLGADLATPPDEKTRAERAEEESIRRLEDWIDTIEEENEPLRNFILPGGTDTASVAHFARTVCRRGERAVVRLARLEEVNPVVLVYLNRLSDLLFVLARGSNRLADRSEEPWKPA